MDYYFLLLLLYFTFPSLVIAAKIVEEYGAQATSVTEVFSSKVKMGDL